MTTYKEEENIYVDSKEFIYLFNFDYISQALYISIWDKQHKKYVVKEHCIERTKPIQAIRKTVCQKQGTIFKKGNTKFMIRIKEETTWSPTNTITIIDPPNPYDPRIGYKNLPLTQQIIPFLKETWLKI